MTVPPNLLKSYIELRDKLSETVNTMYPIGCVVEVENPRYKGQGIVTGRGDCPLGKLAVRLSNGNTWWYELETIKKRVTDKTEWESWIQILDTE